MISVIVPVYNRADLTARFIATWKQVEVDPSRAELIIVNDGSTDGTKELLRRNGCGSLRTISREENLGFTKTCNEGARLAVGTSLIFVNNDVLYKESFVDVASTILNSVGDCVFGAQFIEIDTGWNMFNNNIIPYIPGWFLGCNRKVFDRIGGFDERYSPYDYEDLDFCYSALKFNYPLVKGEFRVQHISGQSFPDHAKRRPVTESNRIKFAEKWGLNVSNR